MTAPGAVFQAGPRSDPGQIAVDLPGWQARTRRNLRELLGPPPFVEVPPLDLRVVEQVVVGDLVRDKLRYGTPTDDIVWAWRFTPVAPAGSRPAVICLPGSFMTPNWGKDAPAGLEGPLVEGDPEAYGVDLARAGFVTLCPDYPCCGERTEPGLRSHDTTRFDERFPNWSRVGMSAWDVSRAVDVLRATPEVDPARVGVCGWSQGGQMSLIGAALDERIAACVSVCGWGPLRGLGGDRALNWTRSYNFPRLAPCLERGQPLPLDFDDIVACVAPRPVLDVRAAQDGTFPNRQTHRQALAGLARLWELAGAADRFRSVEVPGDHAHGAVAAREEQTWLGRWLSP